MRRKLIYTITGITFFTLSLLAPLFILKAHKPIVPTTKVSSKSEQPKTASAKKITSKIEISKIVNFKKESANISVLKSTNQEMIKDAALKVVINQTQASNLDTGELIALTATKVAIMTQLLQSPEPVKSKVLKKVTTNNSTLRQMSFEQLPGWNDAGVKKSLLAFQKSCETFLKQSPNHSVGSQHIKLKAKDWHPACKEALLIDADYEVTARVFFEKWFYPIELGKNKPVRGLFTGYYMPLLKGNLTRTKKYNTPIYGLPRDLKWNTKKGGSYHTRAEIDHGVLKKKAPVIAWIDSPIERLFMEIEGSGVIKLSSGKNLYLGYAGENGAPYTSIGSVLIKKGVMTRHNASKRAIKRYLESEPSKANTILQKNKSFVFFEHLKKPMALGAQGMALTPGYSLAIDKKWIPLGAPLWLNTKIPDQQKENDKKFQRLMIAQDTGGAINGLMRGDIYWGSGKKAAYLGEHMKNEGKYWLLLPKRVFDKLATFNSWSRIY